MSPNAEDRMDIHEVIALHGHLCDAEAHDRFGEVFTSDLEVDAGDVGLAPLPPGDPTRARLDVYIDAARRIGPSAHAAHVTNVVVREHDDGAPGLVEGPDRGTGRVGTQLHLRGPARADGPGLAHPASGDLGPA